MREIKNKRKKVPSVIFQEKKTRSKTENKLICSRFFFFLQGKLWLTLRLSYSNEHTSAEQEP
jgi:hypothetical protein